MDDVMFWYGFLAGFAVAGFGAMGLFIAWFEQRFNESGELEIEPWAAEGPYLSAFAQLKREELRAIMENRTRNAGVYQTKG